MLTTTETAKNYEGIDSNKENNNVLNKKEENYKTVSNIKQQMHEDAISSITKHEDILSDYKENAYPVDTQLHHLHITDSHKNETSNNLENQVAEIDPTTDEKAVKKKLKKLRQKLKKQTEKIHQIEETKTKEMETIKEEDEVTELQKEFDKEDCPATTSKNLDHVDDVNNDVKDTSNVRDDSDEELDFLNNIPAFVHAAIKKDNKKVLITKTYRQGKDNMTKVTFKQTNFSSDTLHNDNDEYYDIDQENDFTLVKYKHSKHPDSLQASEDFAKLAISLILANQISEAIQHLSTAINLDPKNVCHYANRSFCFLRTGSYTAAVKDATFVIKNTSDNTILAKANYLLGKAYFALTNYEEAEKSIQNCIELFPQDLCYIRELLYFKACQLVNMGFCEKDTLLALKSHSTVMDAMEKLITETSILPNNNSDTVLMSYDETEIFYSDDEDNHSNTKLLSSIIEEKFPHCHDRINKISNRKLIKNIFKTTCKSTK